MSHQFNDIKTLYDCFRNNTGAKNHREFYDIALERFGVDPIIRHQALLERDWIEHKRPYYNVWPTVIPMFLRLKLDLPISHLTVPEFPLLVRLPVGSTALSFEDKGNRYCLKSFLMGEHVTYDNKKQFGVWMDFGEVAFISRSPEPITVLTFKKFLLDSSLTIEQALNAMVVSPTQPGVNPSEEFVLNAVRLACALMLLNRDDDSLIEPDIIQADKEKYEATKDPKYIDRSHRRGKVGWDIGKKIEVAPHERVPHFAWYHTGPKGSQLKLIWRKGAKIHENKLKQIPTGYLDDETPPDGSQST